MRKIAFILCVLLLTGCKGDGGGAAADTQNNLVPGVPTPTPEPAPDYSQIVCGINSTCSKVCEVAAPHSDEEFIRANYCWNEAPDSALCNAIADYHYDLYQISNDWCKSLKVTEVMSLENLTSSTCSLNAACVAICDLRYDDYYTDAQIKHMGGVDGATLKRLVRNDVDRRQHQACLDSPEYFILFE